MPFSPASLTALIQTPGFCLWHYRTGDPRATVVADGYFPDGSGFRAGDVMILQALDAFALLPVRGATTVGTGLSLDGAVAPLAMARGTAARFAIRQTASAVVKTIALAPLAAGILAGGTIPVSAQVSGPVPQVTFSLIDRTGAVVPPLQTIAVTGGVATASIVAPTRGSGFRVQVSDAADPAFYVRSPSFSVVADAATGRPKLTLEGTGGLLTEDRLLITP